MDVVVVGAGQAGLTVSRELRLRGVDHVVLERSRVGASWRSRWDTFSLVTPNWTMDLPGQPYDGDDPEGHVHRDEIVDYLERYAAGQATEVREGVAVNSLVATASAPLRLETSEGPLEPRAVVVCTGAFQRPHGHPATAALPSSVEVVDATGYRHPDQLPDGPVLVVGSGQTGIQIAEDLHLAGREVIVACGRAPWVPRRAGGLDIVTWVARTSFLDQPRSALPSPEARLISNLQVTGRDGGHDLNYRVLQELGVELTGRLERVVDGHFEFADDLADSVAFGDARYDDIRNLLTRELGVEAPRLPDPEPFRASPRTRLEVGAVRSVVVATGFRPDYRGWVRFPVFDELGFPVVDDELRTAVPGLYFCGVHFLRKRRSSLLFGVGEDAALLAATIDADLRDGALSTP